MNGAAGKGHRRRLSTGLSAAAVLVLSLVVALGFLEVLLRTVPTVFGPRLLNHAFSRYGTFTGGMYFREPVSGTLFMKPRFRTTASWNGYFWSHQTDEYGFRNHEGARGGEVLLLGDSLIYGHGVEEEQTAAHYLRTIYDQPAYNMSRQGDALYQHYLLLRLYLDEFRPREVILFFFINDFFDVETFRTAEELDEAPEVDGFDYRRIRSTLDREGVERASLPRELIYRLAAFRLFRGLAAEFLATHPAVARAAGKGEGLPPYLEPYEDPRRLTELQDYYRHVLGDLVERCRAAGAEVKVVNLALEKVLPEEALPALRSTDLFLSALAGELGISYWNAGPVFAGCGVCFLPRDGHFTGEGHRRLAGFLDGKVLGPEEGGGGGPRGPILDSTGGAR